MRREKILNIGEILQDKEFENLRSVADENLVVEKFGKIFPNLGDIVQPKQVKDGVLFLHVENSVWRSELHLQRKIMIEKINKYFNKILIKSIRFK